MTSKKLQTLLIAATLLSSIGCSLLEKTPTKFEPNWSLHYMPGEKKPLACIPEEDVIELRKVLIECELCHKTK